MSSFDVMVGDVIHDPDDDDDGDDDDDDDDNESDCGSITVV